VLDWESDKSIKHDRESLTELLEWAFYEPYLIQQVQLAEVGWEFDNKDSSRKEVGQFVLSFGQLMLYWSDVYKKFCGTD